MRFVDTNILLYAGSTTPGAERKRTIAVDILHDVDLALSVQVLQEFYVQATRSTRPDRLSHAQAVGLIGSLRRFPIQPVTAELVTAALESKQRFAVSYWDAAILEAARSLGCDTVLSEDLSHGQDYDGVVVRNPFA